MNNASHWTHQSTTDYVYSISSSFVSQLEMRMEEKGISKTGLADLLQVSPGRISQVYNNPGNLSLRSIVDHARALGMKVGIIAYDDGDPSNHDGPINPNVFVKSWEALDRPHDLFEVSEAAALRASMDWKWDPPIVANQFVVVEIQGVFHYWPVSIIGEPRELQAAQQIKPQPHLVWPKQELTRARIAS